MRLTITKTKSSELLYINHGFRDKNGKVTSRVFKKLGKIEDLCSELNMSREEVIAWGKQQAKIETEKWNAENESISATFSPTTLIPFDESVLFNVGYLFIQSILSSMHWNDIFKSISRKYNFEYDLKEITAHLIYARFIDPSSKRSAYETAKSLIEKPEYQLHDIYRALSVLAKEAEFIQSKIYENSHFIQKRNKSVLYYDCTNYYFEIEQEEGLKKYGKSKEHRPNPFVQMGLFMDADGIPLSFDVFPGNQNEQLSLIPLEKKIINDFNMSKFIFCSDGGLASKKNKLFNSLSQRGYVITQSIKKMKKEDQEIALNPTQWCVIGSNQFIDLRLLDESDERTYNTIFYKELPVTVKGLDEVVIITYSPKYKAYQKSIRENQIERAEKIILNQEKMKRNRRNPNDPMRFITETSTTDSGEIATSKTYEINEDAILNESKYDGFYAVATNLENDIEEIININKQRWKIESCFRLMKTDFEARPVYVQREDRIKAHFLICFLSLLCYRLIENKLENKYTSSEIIHTIKEMNMFYIKGLGYAPTYKRNNLTEELHSIFKFRTDYEIITKNKMREIINSTKK